MTPAWIAYLAALNLHRAGQLSSADLAKYRAEWIEEELASCPLVGLVAQVVAGWSLAGRVGL